MFAANNVNGRWLTCQPSLHAKASCRDILDISQDGHLDGLGSLKGRIIDGIFKASPGKRQIPIEVMYQGEGADLYAAYASSPAYYLYPAERWIIQTYAHEMASLIADRSSIELGAGSLEKTRLLLQAIAQASHIVCGIDYYALDINRKALVESLASLPALERVKCQGLFGTHHNALHHVAEWRRQSVAEPFPCVFMLLGAGLQNLTMEGAARMVDSIADVMRHGDMILVRMDGWTSDELIDAAYRPADKLVLNTLKNANEILGEDDFDMSRFVFSTRVNHQEGRNECYRMVSDAIELRLGNAATRLERGERILVVPSYKYTDEQVVQLAQGSGLEVVRRFGTPADAHVHYRVWLWRKVGSDGPQK
ncbi:hypothetical protein EC968_002997 [Mortierella alpina]|nr:hypothetical protein EC968_002997 [Mortierella alpina]